MKNKVIIEKIIRYIDKIVVYTNSCTYESFSENSILVEACVFNLSQIGELANRLDNEFRETNSEIPWHVLYGLRNRIVHDYEGVNLVLIWDIVSVDLIQLREQLYEIEI